MRATWLVIAIALGAPGALAALHLGLLSAASLFYREPAVRRPPRLRFLTIVPARDEERVIGETLRSLAAAARPDDLVLVVADRCTDRTADVARSFGVEVLERRDGDPPGRAASIRDGLRHSGTWEWEVSVTVDADSIVNPEFYDALESVFATGAQAVQARSEHIRRPGILARLSEAAFAMQGVSIPRGRDALGLGPRLRGSGMALRREVVRRFGFSTEGASEDLVQSLDLTLEGILARHADSARLESLSAPDVGSAAKQRLRWEAGRMMTARKYAGRLLRAGSPAAIESAIHLVTPPFAVAAFSVILGGLVALLGGWPIGWWVFAALLGVLAASLAVALIEARAPAATWLALVAAPVYILWKVWVQIVAVFRVGEAGRAYDPTARE